MPFVRCREYDEDGRPINVGCQRADCGFVHPTEPAWPKAPPSRRASAAQGSFSSGRGRASGRGRGRGRGGVPSGHREKTGSNTIGGGDSGWGSVPGSKSSAWGGSWGGEVDKTEGSSTGGWEHGDTGNGGWSSGWGSGDGNAGWSSGLGTANDSAKKDEKGKGQEADTASSWGGGSGWGQMDVDTDKPASASWANFTSGANGTSGFSEWGESGAKVSEANTSGWAVSGTSETAPKQNAAAAPSLGVRRASNAKFSDSLAKKPRIESPVISLAESPVVMDVVPAQNPATPLMTVKPSIPSATNAVPSNFVSNRQFTPDTSMASSRSTSVGANMPRKMHPQYSRSLKSVSHKEAKIVWSEYVTRIYRPIMLRLRLNEERATYQNYRKAQNSTVYQRVGSRGTDLLNQSTHTLKGRVERVDREYKYALQKLCDFEEGFDFPMHILATRKEDVTNVKGEVVELKEYVKNVGTCLDSMASAVEYIDKQAHAIPDTREISAPSAAVVQEGVQAPVRVVLGTSLGARLSSLEEKFSDLSNMPVDPHDGLSMDEIIKEKLDEMKATIPDLTPMEDNDGLTKKMDKLDDDQTSLGKDVEDLASNVAEIYGFFGHLKETQEQEKARLNISLEEDHKALAASKAHLQVCQELMQKLAEEQEALRAEVHALEVSNAPSPPNGVSNEFLDQLISNLLPAIQSDLDPHINSAMELLTSSAADALQEYSRRQVKALATALVPVYKLSVELQKKSDFRLPLNGVQPRPVSSQVGEA